MKTLRWKRVDTGEVMVFRLTDVDYADMYASFTVEGIKQRCLEGKSQCWFCEGRYAAGDGECTGCPFDVLTVEEIGCYAVFGKEEVDALHTSRACIGSGSNKHADTMVLRMWRRRIVVALEGGSPTSLVGWDVYNELLDERRE